jgi:hypothetical protein
MRRSFGTGYLNQEGRPFGVHQGNDVQECHGYAKPLLGPGIKLARISHAQGQRALPQS